MIKRIFIFVVILLILAGGYYVYSISAQSSPLTDNSEKQRLVVKVVKVAHHTLFDEIEALGTAFANEAVNITTSASDKIDAIHFDDGQEVKKGDVLVVLQQSEELAQMHAEKAQILEHERELKRLENLLKKNATAQNQYDARKTLVSISKHRIEEIEARIDDKTIRAPFDGVLGPRKISVGSLVEQGTLITTLDDISQIKLDFSVPSTFLAVLKRGQAIQAESEAFEGKKFTGTVMNIASRINERTRSVEVRAVLPNPKYLIKPGMLFKVRLYKNERKALLIPEEALIQLHQNHYVLRVNEDKTVERLSITLGKREPGWVEVISGLDQGDQIIVRGLSHVRPGDKVEIEVVEYSRFK